MSLSYRWQPEERATLIKMRSEGARLVDIGAELGRSLKAVSLYMKRNGMQTRYRARSQRKPKPYMPPQSVIASQSLRDAIGAAVMRFAANHRMSVEEAQAFLIGSEPSRAPRRIRFDTYDYTGHRPEAIVARPIGEITTPIAIAALERGIA